MPRWVRTLEALRNRRLIRKSALAKRVVQTAGAAAKRVFAHARIASVIAAARVLNPAVLAVAWTMPQLRQRQSMKTVAAKVAARSIY